MGTVYNFPAMAGRRFRRNTLLRAPSRIGTGNIVTISQGSGGNITETDTAVARPFPTSAPLGTNGTVSISGLSNPYTVTWETIALRTAPSIHNSGKAIPIAFGWER